MQIKYMALLALVVMINSSVHVAAQGPLQGSPQTTPLQSPLPLAITAPTQQARSVPDDKCWTDWSEAAVIARRELLLPVEQVSRLAGAKHPGAAIIKVTLCEEQGKFVYRLLLRERLGQLKSELLDARQTAGQ